MTVKYNSDTRQAGISIYHLLLPVGLYVFLTALIYVFNWDYKLSHYLFSWQGDAWNLKKNFFTETIIHRYGKYTSIVIYLALVLLYGLSFYKKTAARLMPYKKGLLYLVVSTLTATLSISILKSMTQIDCPWSIVGLGGDEVYQPWLNLLFIPHDGAKCFPSGHASAAYAFFSVYFFAYYYFPRQAVKVLLLVLVTGLVFGFAQQLRGAHFISHDITTAFICWIINLAFYYLILVSKKKSLPDN